MLGDDRLRSRLIDLITYWTIYQDEIFLFTSCPYFVDHGMPHAQNVARIFATLAGHLSPDHALSDNELFLGTCACYLHDVGMFHPGPLSPDETRRRHGALSQQRIQAQRELFLLCGDEPGLVGLLAAYHQSSADLETLPAYSGFTDFWQREWRPRTRLLAALLSLADACDMGAERFSGIKAVRDQYLEGWRQQREQRLEQLEQGAPEAYGGELSAIRREIPGLVGITPVHYDIHRAIRRVHVEKAGGVCDIVVEPAALQAEALTAETRKLLDEAQEMIHRELVRSRNVLQVALPFFSSVRVGHPDVPPRAVERAAVRSAGYREAPGMRQIYRYLRQRQAAGNAPDALIGVSNGGMLAASLLSRWTNIPLGGVLRTQPRSQTLTYGRDVRQSRIIGATDLAQLAAALGRDVLQLALVEDVCRTGTSLLMAARALRAQAVPVELGAMTLIAGEAIGHLKRLAADGGPDGAEELYLDLASGEQERDQTIVMPWETDLTAGNLNLEAAASLLAAMEERFAQPDARPAALVGISNGGAILASHLALYFNIPATCLTRDNPGRQWLGGGQEPQASNVMAWPDLTEALAAGSEGTQRIMLVDDISRSGHSLMSAVESLRSRQPGTAIDAALLYAGRGPVGEDLEGFRRRLARAGCGALLCGGLEPALGTRLPWDVRPEGA